MSSNTAFVLVPGSFSYPDIYHKVSAILKSKGHEVHETPLLSAGERAEGPATMADDAAHIASVITKLADQGKDVVMSMNSYGGFPGSEAAKGLGLAERASAGKKGGLVGLVYIASFLPPVGTSLKAMMGENLPDSIKTEEDYMKLNPAEDYKNIFSDISDADGQHYMAQMPNHSKISFSGELSYAGYKHVPSTFFHTKGDKIIPPEAQMGMIEAARKDGANIKVVESGAGHVPMLSVPEEVARALLDAAGLA